MTLNYVIDLVIDRVDLVDEGANSEAFIKLCKRKESSKSMNFEDILKELKPEHAAVITAEIAKAKVEVPEAVQQDLAKAKADLNTAMDEKKALEDKIAADEELNKAKQTQDNFEELLKSMNPAARLMFETLSKQKEAAEAALKQANDERLEAEALSKAKQLKALPIEEEKLVTMMKSVPPDVFTLLQSVNKLIEDSPAFKEVGKSKGTECGDAWEKIEKMAGDLSKTENITQAEAIRRVVKDNPALYKEYLEGSNS